MTSRGDIDPDIVVRFAPSPNGWLHLGHAYAAMVGHDRARSVGGKFLLRIEDIDLGRSRPEYAEAIIADLQWLGLSWDGEVIFQSQRFDDYARAIDQLRQGGLLYPCFCTRSEMRQMQSVDQSAAGADEPVYAGTCRHLSPATAQRRIASEAHSWRLDIAKAAALTGPLTWSDERRGTQIAQPQQLGDVVIVPKQMPVSYHLAVTVDDARDQISHVVRGMDLFAATHIHRLLQALLDLPTPIYHHHPLLLDDGGGKLSKRRGSAALRNLRQSGHDGAQILADLRQGRFPVGISSVKD